MGKIIKKKDRKNTVKDRQKKKHKKKSQFKEL